MAKEQVQKPSSRVVPVQKKVSGFAPSASRVQAKDVTAGEQEQMPLGSTPATDANWLMKHPLFKGNQFLQRVVAPASESESLESEESLAQRETVQRQEEGNKSGALQVKPVSRSHMRPEEPETQNITGLPDELKAGVENLSGYSLDDVRVHYNSPKPAQLKAFAYTQDTEIHVASGQENHLPHEVWHVVQQKQGRVKPTIQTKGVAINDDLALETEADVMGEKALQMQLKERTNNQVEAGGESLHPNSLKQSVLQLVKKQKGEGGGSDNEEEKSQKLGPTKTIKKNGRTLRGNKQRVEQYVLENTRKHGQREGTRTHNAAKSDAQAAYKKLGEAHSKIVLKNGPPAKHNGRKIYQGERQRLSFTKETQNTVYNRYPQRVNNGRTEYQVNGKWLSKLGDAAEGEDYASIDHNPNWASISRGLETHEIEYEGHRYEVVYQDEARALYNDSDDPARKNLRLMAQSENSSRGGLKGADSLGPKDLGAIEEEEEEYTQPDEIDAFKKDNFGSGPPPPPGTGGAMAVY